jgi:uncharacterized protein (TIGR03000 family)
MRAVSQRLAAAVVVAAVLVSPGARAQEEKDRRAYVVVRCLDNAKLVVDDKPVQTQSGTQRRFKTPPLEGGKRYYYVMAATWSLNDYTTLTRTRKVIVEPGKTAEVDFTKADPKQPDKIFVMYVPTPQKVVDAMLKLARVGKDDVVFDLGCGDGRVVVTAVSKFMAKKGVGVDLDPERIKESKENAKEAGVAAKVEFRQEDVLKVKDLGAASVVFLYLADELNEKLLPVLKKELKDGARIVSHRFLLGNWKPEKTETITVGGEPYQIHLWTVKKPGAPKPAKEEKDKGKKEKKDADAPKDKDKKDKDKAGKG